MQRFIWLGLLSFGGAAAGEQAVAEEKALPLAAYVAKPDESYRWVKRREGMLGENAYVELTLTSQTWREIVWKHQLFILKPKHVRNPSQALLLIGGGSWRDELAAPIDPKAAGGQAAPLPKEAALLATLANEIGSPTAVLLHVPQQPLFDGKKEDEIISYTFEQYLKTGDATWPLLLPMVKSAVRGMDAVQQFAEQNWQTKIERFTVTGASKRGWTAWLTAAVDLRVQAIAPMVIDVLNMGPQMKHQLETWGKFSEQIEDYTQRGIQASGDTKPGERLRGIVDPYSYRESLIQPKLILLGTNDRYWTLDALNLYWNDLQGEKHVLYVPNQGHKLADPERVVGSIAALHRQAAGELAFPKLDWKLDADDEMLRLRLESSAAPAQALVWIAASPTRDFRDAKWSSEKLELVDGAYRYEMPLPPMGHAALFGELKFKGDSLPYYLSTNVKLTPAPKAEK
ncbi:MAG TPA: PhoPQ-activated protein PqaA family protein [Pirellulales bacterium]|nr:PhoPQ-activated protein PqaA family protein [Pirellulales bacterium]